MINTISKMLVHNNNNNTNNETKVVKKVKTQLERAIRIAHAG